MSSDGDYVPEIDQWEDGSDMSNDSIEDKSVDEGSIPPSNIINIDEFDMDYQPKKKNPVKK